MGQRLVMELKKNQKSIATIWFHWSAYTFSAFMEAYDLIHYLGEQGYNPDCTREWILQNTIEYLMGNVVSTTEPIKLIGRGGLQERDENYIRDHEPDLLPASYAPTDNPPLSRNQGMFTTDPAHMKEMIDNEEGHVTIDFDEGKVYNECVIMYEAPDYDRLMKDEREYDLKCGCGTEDKFEKWYPYSNDLPHIETPLNLFVVKFEDMDEVKSILSDYYKTDLMKFYDTSENTVVEFIY